MRWLIVEWVSLFLALVLQLVNRFLQLSERSRDAIKLDGLFGDHGIELIKEVLGVGQLHFEFGNSILKFARHHSLPRQDVRWIQPTRLMSLKFRRSYGIPT